VGALHEVGGTVVSSRSVSAVSVQASHSDQIFESLYALTGDLVGSAPHVLAHRHARIGWGSRRTRRPQRRSPQATRAAALTAPAGRLRAVRTRSSPGSKPSG